MTDHPTPTGQAECLPCRRLHDKLDAATRVNDETTAVDCRVLLRRHPAHDDRPVAARESEA
ncbi:hypothetical protein [Streptomyces sp. NPDC020965]|uniref:hypothetical protein n=1 Tax=Streptomyces sp. NPDC020965 TaxID=3365105 RepID=UPI00379FAA70